MMIWSKTFGLMLAGICLSASALASGWTVTVSQSNGSVSSATTFTVPFTINTTYYTTTPVTATVSTFPQITFLTNASNPPVLVGDGSGYTTGTFAATYSISGKAVNGFQLVVSAFVQGRGQIDWQKVVTDTAGNVLWSGSGTFRGSAVGGTDGVHSLNMPVTLPGNYNNVMVVEQFTLTTNGDPGYGTTTASLLLVEQDWVPEPASLLALGVGLAGLALRRRRA